MSSSSSLPSSLPSSPSEPPAWPRDRAALADAVARVSRPLAPKVHRALVAQNARLAASPARDAQLAALARGAAVVITGQQVGLFLGPLYTIYKAASAVALARALSAELATPVVPMFWLQTEDHDLPEIASLGVPGVAACESITAPVAGDNRISIAHHRLPAEVAGCLDRLDEVLGEGLFAREHIERLRRHYRAGAGWADAFAGVLAELFAPEGLVMIDPRDPALAGETAVIHARALDLAAPIASAMIARNAELERAGRTVQVHVRPGAPLSFFHPEGALGPRVRLEPAGSDAFAEVGSGAVHDRRALLAALRDDPRRFSTSALLRPIVQDTLLPTLAYVGGPAELAYFAQLGPVYAAFERAMPFVRPRARFRVTDPRTRKLLDRLALAPRDAERAEADLLARDGHAAGDAAAVRDQLLAPFLAAHDALAGSLGTPGREITRALGKTRASVERSIGKLASKVERHRLYADAQRVDAVRRVRAMLAPDGAPQERVLGLAGLAARVGDRALIERVLDHLTSHIAAHVAAGADLAAVLALGPFAGTLQELAV